MTIDNIPARLAAIVCALALGTGGTSLLFGDVIAGAADFTQKHLQTICIVVATTGAWLAVTIAAKKRAPIAFLGWLVLSLFGTGVICWYSLGRQTEGQIVSADSHDKAAEERGRLKAKLAEEDRLHTAKRTEADAACKKYGPDHRRCLGARAVEAVYADSLAGIEARLKTQQVKPVDASAEAFGNLVAALGGNREKAKALALLFMPYLITGLFELGFTWSLHDAFRPGSGGRSKLQKPQVTLPAPTQLASVTDTELSTLRAQFVAEPVEASKPPKGPNGGVGSTIRTPKGPKPAAPKRRMDHSEIVSDLMLRAATGRLFGSNEEAAENYGYSPSRFSELVTRWEGQNLIPKGRMVGRCKEIASAE